MGLYTTQFYRDALFKTNEAILRTYKKIETHVDIDEAIELGLLMQAQRKEASDLSKLAFPVKDGSND